MGTPGPTPTQAQGPNPQVQEQGPRPLTVSELLNSLKKMVEDMNSEGVVPQYRLVRSSVDGERVEVEVWRAFEIKSVDVAAEVSTNQICELVELSPHVCVSLRSRVRSAIVEALGEDYTSRDVVVLKIDSKYGRFSISWLPLEPTEDPVNGGYLAGARVTVVVELPAYEGVDREVAWLLGRLEEMLYNLH